MRINSRFKEYYDKGQQWAVSESIVWNRNVSNLGSLSYGVPDTSINVSWWNQVIIGYCGTLYSFLHRVAHEDWNNNEIPEKVAHTPEEYFACFKLTRRFDNESKRKLLKYWATWQDNRPFIENNCPTFVAYKGDICFHTMSRPKTSGPLSKFKYASAPTVLTLTQFEFEKIKPFNIAYQEIESYITGTLFAEHKEVPEMSNEVKVESHGFNKKSFRSSKRNPPP